MAGNTFPGRFGGNSAFANFSMGDGPRSGAIHQVVEEDENDTVASTNQPSFGAGGSVFGEDGTAGPPSSFRPGMGSEGFPSNYGMGRRTSVSAESLNPTATTNDNWTPPVHPKSAEQSKLIRSALSGHTIFGHLDDEQSSQMLGAMVITQGDQGDFFYVVEQGSFDVYVHESGSLQPGANGLGTKVATIRAGGSFGELALLYGSPRNATVISADSGCKLFALDRITFRRILMDSTFVRRRMYEAFLKEVPLLSTLDSNEVAKIADALEPQKFPAGYTIIKEGDKGEAFYLLEAGEAEAYKNGTADPVKNYSKGDYFGELALLNDAPRAASVVSKTEVKIAKLGKDGFQRLLGPVEGIMRRTKYDEDVDPLSKE
ncbi:MAG: hypothetical protein M1818_008129 [Claussenomyces sp. TS43310]|nr:MAG: hypothetical protein M1818_008129 [Claussenomyces sp. TS43310]